MKKDILICGVGGQGTVLASKVIAAAAMDEGYTVHSAETIGMAQRGGPVTSHVRVGDASSPLIPFGAADLLIAFEPAEAARNLHYLKKGGTVIVNSTPVKPSTGANGYDGREHTDYVMKNSRCIAVSSEELCERLGSSKIFNVAVIGIAAGCGALPASAQTVRERIIKTVPARFAEMNMKAFEEGLKIGEEYADK